MYHPWIMKPEGSVAAIFERQWIHALVLAGALPTLWLMSTFCGCFHRGEFLGVSTCTWFWIAIEIPIAHQLFVWFCWRTELHRGFLSRIFGYARDMVLAGFFGAGPLTDAFIAAFSKYYSDALRKQ